MINYTSGLANRMFKKSTIHIMHNLGEAYLVLARLTLKVE